MSSPILPSVSRRPLALRLDAMEERINPGGTVIYTGGGSITVIFDSQGGSAHFSLENDQPDSPILLGGAEVRTEPDGNGDRQTATLANVGSLTVNGEGVSASRSMSVDVPRNFPLGVHATGGPGPDQFFSGGRGVNVFDGGGGDDRFTGIEVTSANTSTVTTSLGGTAQLTGFELFVLTGSAGEDSFNFGGFGPTLGDGTIAGVTITGGGGADHVDGGFGADTIHASGTVYGGPGNDAIVGGDLNDHLYGEGGNDVIDGGPGDDMIEGGIGQNGLSGGGGNDVLDNRLGTRNPAAFQPDNIGLLDGGDDNDTLYASDAGNQFMQGGAGNDTIFGSAYTTGFWGDTIDGGTGSDVLTGNGGRDIAVEIAYAGGKLKGTANGGAISGPDSDTFNVAFEQVDLVPMGAAGTFTVEKYPGRVILDRRGAGSSPPEGPDKVVMVAPGNVSLAHVTPSSNPLDDFKSAYTTANPEVPFEQYGSVEVVNVADFVVQAAPGVGTAAHPLRFNVGGWAKTGITLKGSAGVEEVVATGLHDVKLVNQSILWKEAELNRVDLEDIDATELSGGPKGDKLDASLFTGKARLIGNGGNDTLLGGTNDDTLIGGANNDSLSGGGGDDLLLGGDGNDTMNGGDDDDTVYEEAAKPTVRVTFTATPTTLAGRGADKYEGAEFLTLVGSDVADTFTVRNWAAGAPKLDLQGLAGDDLLTYAGKDAAVKVTDTRLTGTDAAGGRTVDAHLVSIAKATLTAAQSAGTTFEVDDSVVPAFAKGLTLTNTPVNALSQIQYTPPAAGGPVTLSPGRLTAPGRAVPILMPNLRNATLKNGAGADQYKIDGWLYAADVAADAADTLEIVSNAKVQNMSPGGGGFVYQRDKQPAVAVAGLPALTLTGGAGSNRFEVIPWQGPARINGGGGRAADSVLVIGAQDAVTLRDDRVTFTAGGGTSAYALTGVEVATLAGGPNATFDVSGWTGFSALLGDGTAAVTSVDDAAILTLQDGLLKKTPGGETILKGFDHATLGGPDIRVTDWPHDLDVQGGGPDDFFSALGDTDFALQDGAMTLAASGATYTLGGITKVILGSYGSAHTHTISNWTGKVSVVGRAADKVVALADANFVYDAKTAMIALGTGGADIMVKGVGLVDLTNIGTAGHLMDMRKFNGKVILHGGAGNDTLYGGNKADELYGEGGNDRLNGGLSIDGLFGGSGIDTFSTADNKTKEWKDFVEGTDLSGTV